MDSMMVQIALIMLFMIFLRVNIRKRVGIFFISSILFWNDFPCEAMYYIGSNVYNWPLEAQRGLADGRVLIALLDRELTFLLGHELCVRKSLCFSVN